MPALRVPYSFPDARARDAVGRVQEEMGVLLAQNPKQISALPDYFLGFLWIEGFKLVPLEDKDYKP